MADRTDSASLSLVRPPELPTEAGPGTLLNDLSALSALQSGFLPVSPWHDDGGSAVDAEGQRPVFGGLLLLLANVADVCGRRRLYRYGLAVFGGGSVLAGIAAIR